MNLGKGLSRDTCGWHQFFPGGTLNSYTAGVPCLWWEANLGVPGWRLRVSTLE